MTIVRGHMRRLVISAAVGLMATAGMLAPAAGQSPGPDVTSELARKKAEMLELFLASENLSKVRLARPDAAEPLVESARIHLDAGWDMLTSDDPVGAARHFDMGIGAVSAAMALSTDRSAASADVRHRAAETRLREVRAYLDVLARASDLPGDARRQLADLRSALDKADAAEAAGDTDDAAALVNDLYPKVVRLVTRVERGRTAFVSKSFDTPEEALDYERARNVDHRLLVTLALAERAESQPGLNTLAADLTSLNDRLVADAEAHAAAGRTEDAVETMQRATERLSAILRAAGLILSASDANR